MEEEEEKVLKGPTDNWRNIQVSVGARLVSSLKGLQKQILQVYPDMENHHSTADWILMRAASESTQLRVQPGDVVVIVASNTPHFAPAVVAIVCAGAICATVSWETPLEELTNILGNLPARVILCSADLQAKIANSFPGQVTQVLGRDWKTDLSEPRVATVKGFASKTAFYLFTSGSMGLPKKVPLTHAGIDAILNSFRRSDLGLSRSDVIVSPSATFWYMGFIMQLISMDQGIKLVVPARFEPISFLQNVRKNKGTVTLLDACTYVSLCKEEFVPDDALDSVRCMLSAGNCLNERTERYIEDTLQKPLVQWYGSTEVQLTVCAPLVAPHSTPAGSVGKVKPWTQAKVVHLESGEDVDAGVDGELVFRGPFTSPSVAKGVWFRTGDMGHYDERGNFYVVDRIDDLIRYRGSVVPPSELECALVLHPAVKDVVVVGVPDDSEGMLPTAVVSLVEGRDVSAEDLRRHVATTLKDKHLNLRGGVVFVDVVPKTPTGKLKRKLARAMVLQMLGKGSVAVKQ